jgi:hypothetical protein
VGISEENIGKSKNKNCHTFCQSPNGGFRSFGGGFFVRGKRILFEIYIQVERGR